MAEATRCRDSRVQRVLCFIHLAELLERERQAAEAIALVIVRPEIRAQLLHRLGVQPLLERFVRQAEARQHIVRVRRDHCAKGLEPRAHRSITRLLIASPAPRSHPPRVAAPARERSAARPESPRTSTLESPHAGAPPR